MKTNSKKQPGFATRAIHDGQEPDPLTGAVNVPNTNVTDQFGPGGAPAYVDPANPGSIYAPVIAATRGTPETASGLLYGFGFVAATATLHGLGIAIGLAVGRIEAGHGRRLVRLAGSAVAAVGVVMLANGL